MPEVTQLVLSRSGSHSVGLEATLRRGDPGHSHCPAQLPCARAHGAPALGRTPVVGGGAWAAVVWHVIFPLHWEHVPLSPEGWESRLFQQPPWGRNGSPGAPQLFLHSAGRLTGAQTCRAHDSGTAGHHPARPRMGLWQPAGWVHAGKAAHPPTVAACPDLSDVALAIPTGMMALGR